jgi:hypothetical protein
MESALFVTKMLIEVILDGTAMSANSGSVWNVNISAKNVANVVKMTMKMTMKMKTKMTMKMTMKMTANIK